MYATRAVMLWAILAGALQAGVNPKLVGTWSGNGTTIRIEADGRCAVGNEAGKCSSALAAFFYQAPNGQVSNYGWKVEGDQLTLSGNGATMTFRRGAAPEQAPAAPAAGRWSHPTWGVDFAMPAAWKAAEREGQVLIASDTEAGLMVVRFLPSTGREALVAAYGQGLQEDGITLTPTARIEEFAGRGVAGELGGAGPNGQRLQARVIGIPTGFGDSAIFLALTTAEHYAALKARVDAMAASARFTRPTTPPANIAIAGRYSFLFVSNTGGSYQRQDNLSLCGNGVFYRGGEMSGSGPSGSAVTARQDGGRWTADGDGQNGTVTLQYANGQQERLRYQKSGPDIVLNGRKYGRFGDGSCR